jgi:uncharacterized protein YqjF (DUF2071 family)
VKGGKKNIEKHVSNPNRKTRKKNFNDYFLKANWENIIMANYEIDPKILLPFLPKGVELDLYNGKAYMSLVGFMFKKIKLFNVPIRGLAILKKSIYDFM